MTQQAVYLGGPIVPTYLIFGSDRFNGFMQAMDQLIFIEIMDSGRLPTMFQFTKQYVSLWVWVDFNQWMWHYLNPFSSFYWTHKVHHYEKAPLIASLNHVLSCTLAGSPVILEVRS
jgi:sterol desaturase/sphingolipid hydroxylase (fatty acid hydroxylase superfamily)